MQKLPPIFQTGQALLLVLLSMAVVLTVVLSILSRSITDIAVSTKEEESLRAFSAAEAGVEQVLIGGSLSDTFANNSSYLAEVSGIGEASSSYGAPDTLLDGESTTLWFIDHDADSGELTCATGNCFTGNSFKACWGEDVSYPDPAFMPAVEISVFYDTDPADGDYQDVTIARAAFDPNIARFATNNFSLAGGTCTISGSTYAFSATIDLTASGLNIGCRGTAGCLLTAVLRMFYNGTSPHPVGFDASGVGNSLIPTQGLRIISTGISGESTRKVEVFRTFGELPPVFNSVFFSPSGAAK